MALTPFAELLAASRRAVRALPDAVAGRGSAQPAGGDARRAGMPRDPRAGGAPPHPRRRTRARGGRQPRLVGTPPGGMAAGRGAGRWPLVPGPRHPHERGRGGPPGGERGCRRPVPHHRGQSRRRPLSGPPLPRGRRERIGLGSDSNVLIDAAEELRLLEYGQRLEGQGRNLLASAGRPSTGGALFAAAGEGGARALGVERTGLTVGAPADIVGLDPNHPSSGRPSRRRAAGRLDLRGPRRGGRLGLASRAQGGGGRSAHGARSHRGALS